MALTDEQRAKLTKFESAPPTGFQRGALRAWLKSATGDDRKRIEHLLDPPAEAEGEDRYERGAERATQTTTGYPSFDTRPEGHL